MEPVFLSSPLAVNSKGIMGIGRVSAIEPIPDSLRTLGITQEGLIGIWIDDLFYKSNHPGRKSRGDEVGKACFIGKDRKLAVDLERSRHDCSLRMWQYDDSSGFFVSGVSDSITETIYSVVFHPNGSVVYSTKDGIFQLDSNLKNPRRITDISGEMVFSRDGQFLAVYDNGEVYIRQMEGNTASFRISPGMKFCGDFHPTSNLLASGDRDGAVRLTDPKTGTTVAEVQNAHSTFIHSVRFNSTGKILATGDHYGVIKLWVVDGHHLTHLSTLQKQEAPVLALAFRSDDQTLVAGGWDGGQLYIWKAHWKTWLSMACRRLISLDILDTLEGNLKEFIERHANLDKEIKNEK
jgi:WD40 repeat protein